MTITTLVEPVTSLRVGHETRRNSIKTSWKNSRTFLSASIPCLRVLVFVAGQEGFEPPSPGFGVRCSSR